MLAVYRLDFNFSDCALRRWVIYLLVFSLRPVDTGVALIQVKAGVDVSVNYGRQAQWPCIDWPLDWSLAGRSAALIKHICTRSAWSWQTSDERSPVVWRRDSISGPGRTRAPWLLTINPSLFSRRPS